MNPPIPTDFISQKDAAKKALHYQLIGFGGVLVIFWIDQMFDIPHQLFGGNETVADWVEAIVESILIIGLCAITVTLTSRLLKRIAYLEGFLHVCCFCKRIRIEEEWIPIEKFLSEKTSLSMSHTYCPDCAQEHYGEYFQKKERQKTGEIRK